MGETNSSFFVHESSYLDAGAVVGEGTKIWHFSHVQSGAKIGNHCSIGQNVNISASAVIGNHVKIQNNVSVYDRVVLEDYVFCGPSMVFTNVVNPRSEISRKHEFKETRVRTGATIGANATIICGATLGRYALIGSGAVVTHDVPDFALMVGVPARQKGWICQCGIGLTVEDNAAQCQACDARYKLRDGVLSSTTPELAPR